MTTSPGPSLFAEIASNNSGITTARLVGPSIGQREAPIINESIVAALTAATPPIRWLILDFASVTFINSMGLGMLIDLRNRTHKLGGKTALTNLNAELLSLLKMVKLEKLFAMPKSSDELKKLIG